MDGVGSKRWRELVRTGQRYRERCDHLTEELAASRAAVHQVRGQMAALELELAKARAEIDQTKKQMATRIAQLEGLPVKAAPPRFVKANVVKDPQNAKAPGRKAGHAAAHRPMPAKVDVHVDVPVPRDGRGRASCPACRVQLHDVKTHERIVEDIVPAQRIVTCYHTISGYCQGCRKRVESRATEQPPLPAGVEMPQSQLGLNALATAVLLRMQYRLPFRQITGLFLDLPGLSVSAGAVARQIQRMAHWLEGQHQRLQVLVQSSPVVNIDETGWRVDGQNHWLWTMLSGRHTVYHVDKSRGGKVAGKLLGEHFAGTLVSDFYSAYRQIECPKQKCLAHLLRDLHDTAERYPSFKGSTFDLRCGRLVQEMLWLKKKKGKIAPVRYQAKGRKLERRVKELAQGPEGGWSERQANRLAKRLRGHENQLTHFLWHHDVEGTNNAAERAIRPAVVARKISGGSRSLRGAQAGAILLSILRTASQQNHPLLETTKTLLTAHWAGKNPGLLTDILVQSA